MIIIIIRMIQDQNHLQAQSTLLILSNHQSDFLQLQALLCTYFPSAKKGQIHLDTKYYQADVQIIRQEWPQQNQVSLFEPSDNQQQQTSSNPNDKQDLLIMLANENESFSSRTYDYVISKYNPENYILIVNTKDKLMPWVEQEKISNEVNNFIQIIKENLQLLNKNPPERTKKGLLTDTYEDGNIFNLLQLIQTTPWSKISRKVFEKNEKAKPEPTLEQNTSQKQAVKKEQQLQKQQKEPQEQEQEMTDQQLQSEMNAFEGMMKEMLSLRAASSQSQKTPDDDRKKKAEELMKKLVGGWM